MNEIERIIHEKEMESKWDSINYKLCLIMDKNPEGIMYENMTDEHLEKLVKLSLKHEFYMLTAEFEKEKLKRRKNKLLEVLGRKMP